ncbi:PREDICTED: uncharacterized protein LOC108778388 [Cyphomyrmex costatus]|uniref:uncharacterized protein LOC108778388 n=1 Tax=Cyphomyrmex costatus TaxID=456900 RepID=UPI0008522863|nr:PREDICTED: uncharacterized protein LOC108778388 [Cyphomyrmex costatus]
MFFLILLDADCSGRMLATILVAWVTTAMIASILLQWEHMWVVLVILTLLFFLVCGYTVYTVKRTHARILIEQQRAAIRTISDITANRRQAGSSTYAVHSSPDLPPSYASVMTVQGTSRPTQMSTTINPSNEDKFENPPPYSIVIASINAAQEQNVEMSRERHVPSVSTEKNDAAVSTTSALASASQTYPHPR